MKSVLVKIVVFMEICGPIISTKTNITERVALLEDLSVIFMNNHWKFPLIYGYSNEGNQENSIKTVKAFSAHLMPITIVDWTRTTSGDPMLIMLNDGRYLTDVLTNVETWKVESVIIALMSPVEKIDDIKTTVIKEVKGKNANFYIAYFQLTQGNEWQALSILSTPRFKMPVIKDQHFAPGSRELRSKPYDLRGEPVYDVTLDFEPYVSSVECPLNPIPGCDMVGFFIDYFSAAASQANFRYRQGTT